MTKTEVSAPLFLEIGRTRYQVADLRDASEKFCAARDASGLGASDIPPVHVVTAAGERVARVSYNGRVWPAAEWHVGQAPIYDNRAEVA